jgi:hypothetical protein
MYRLSLKASEYVYSINGSVENESVSGNVNVKEKMKKNEKRGIEMSAAMAKNGGSERRKRMK